MTTIAVLGTIYGLGFCLMYGALIWMEIPKQAFGHSRCLLTGALWPVVLIALAAGTVKSNRMVL